MTDIRHLPGCPRPEPRIRRGNLGDVLATCRSCGRFAVVGEPATPPPAPAPAPAPAVRSSYVCRTHHEPVTWRGKGCKECARAHTQRKEKDESAI